MYTLQNSVTNEYLRFKTGGLMTFALMRTVRAKQRALNASFGGLQVWRVRRENAS